MSPSAKTLDTPFTRRHFLLALPGASLLASCAGDLSRYRGDTVPALATQLDVCSATYATVKAGQAQPPRTLTGCETARPQPDPIYQAASLTKPVIAYAALGLVLAGQLDLQAPVSRYLPRGYIHYHSALARGPGDASDLVPAGTLSRIPVASLLNHTSGLPNWTSGALAPGFEPGEKWQYSGEGYVLLQSVIEAVTGMPIAAYIGESVFGPLGMRDSSLVWRPADAGRAESGRSRTGAARHIRFNSPVAAASLSTTAADYAQFLSSFLAHDELVALTLSRPVPVDRALGLEWGHGWGIERTAAGPLLWQWGNNPGFRAFSMISPSSKDGFVMLTNSDQGMALAVPLAHEVLPGEHNVFRFGMVG